MPRRASTDRGRLRRLAKETHDNMTSDVMLNLLDQLRTDPTAIAEIKANPKRWLKSKGVSLSRGVSVEFTENSPYVVCCTYNYGYHKVTYCYTLY